MRRSESIARRARVIELLRKQESVDAICGRVRNTRPEYVRLVAAEIACEVQTERAANAAFVRRVKERAPAAMFSAWAKRAPRTPRGK